jgi:hypothetical protein
MPPRLILFIVPAPCHTYISSHSDPQPKYKRQSKISMTEFIVWKLKYLQVTLSYLLLSTILQTVCSDSSNPSTFQCMCGRPVSEWPAAANVIFSCISAMSWNHFPFRMLFSPGERKKSHGTKSGKQGSWETTWCCAWGQGLPGTQSHVAWSIVVQ